MHFTLLYFVQPSFTFLAIGMISLLTSRQFLTSNLESLKAQQVSGNNNIYLYIVRSTAKLARNT